MPDPHLEFLTEHPASQIDQESLETVFSPTDKMAPPDQPASSDRPGVYA